LRAFWVGLAKGEKNYPAGEMFRGKKQGTIKKVSIQKRSGSKTIGFKKKHHHNNADIPSNEIQQKKRK